MRAKPSIPSALATVAMRWPADSWAGALKARGVSRQGRQKDGRGEAGRKNVGLKQQVSAGTCSLKCSPARAGE